MFTFRQELASKYLAVNVSRNVFLGSEDVLNSAYPKMPAGELMTRSAGSRYVGTAVSRFVQSLFAQFPAVHSERLSALRQGELESSGYRQHGVEQLHGDSGCAGS